MYRSRCTVKTFYNHSPYVHFTVFLGRGLCKTLNMKKHGGK